MSKIEDLIKQYCPDGVEWKKLGDVCDITTGKLNANAAVTNGKYLFFTCSSEPSYIDEYAFDTDAILISGNGNVGELHSYCGKFNAYQRTYVLDKFADSVMKMYLYHYMNEYLTPYTIKNCRKGSVPYITLSMLQDFQIPIPHIAVQDEIVRILDKFTELEKELEKELELRRKQYEFYRDKLLTFDGGVDWKRFGDIAEFCTGSRNTQDAVENGRYDFFVRSQTPLKLDEYDYDDESVVTAGDGVGVGKVFHITYGKYALHQRAYRIHPLDKCVLNVKYLYYIFSNNFYDYIMMQKYNGSVASVRLPMLKSFEIPVPSPTEQERIVKILDKFDTLTTSLMSGLPAEIKLRKQQYEYYRDYLFGLLN